MKILVACENSGTVRDAFTRRGHDATSCDLLESETPGKHYVGDARDLLGDGWDLLIAHPPCTYLSASGMHWTTRGLRDPAETEAALEFVRELLLAPIERIAIENPVGAIASRFRLPATQYVQPYQFGDDASKNTGLWLKNLPPLEADPAKFVAPRLVEFEGKTVERWGNQTDSGQNKLPPSDDRWKLRSVTFQGIAEAMAEQWNGLAPVQLELLKP